MLTDSLVKRNLPEATGNSYARNADGMAAPLGR
jgi:hypothetical protein